MSKTLPLIILAAGLAAAALAVGSYREFLHDDAFITLRYARNALAGDGLVWNPGERVEGYSSFLHLVLCVGGGALGAGLVATTRILGCASLAVIVGVVAWSGRRQLARRGLAGSLVVVPVALLLGCGALWVWAFGGLEANLFAALCTAGVWACYHALGERGTGRGALVGGVLLALACLARLDGVLLAAWAGVFFLLGPGRGRDRLRRTALFVLPFVLVFVPYFAWKLSYYGDLLPNTFYAKATSPSAYRWGLGARYVGGWCLAPPYPGVLLALGLLAGWWRRAFDRRAAFVLLALVTYGAYVAFVGGDQMPAYRLLLPGLPSAVLLGFVGFLPWFERAGTVRWALLTAGVLAVLTLGHLRPGRSVVIAREPNAAALLGTAVGKHIAARWPEGSLVALHTAGAPPFHAPAHRFLDMLGLNDRHIARRKVGPIRLPWQRVPGHAKGDGAYVLSRAPDYVILGPTQGTVAAQPWFLSDLELAEDREFARRYRPRRVRIDVRDVPGWERHPLTRGGELVFTYYERVAGAR